MGAKLDHPAGLAFGPADNGNTVLYIVSRMGRAINKYVLNGGTVTAQSTLVSNFPDEPEQLVSVNIPH